MKTHATPSTAGQLRRSKRISSGAQDRYCAAPGNSRTPAVVGASSGSACAATRWGGYVQQRHAGRAAVSTVGSFRGNLVLLASFFTAAALVGCSSEFRQLPSSEDGLWVVSGHVIDSDGQAVSNQDVTFYRDQRACEILCGDLDLTAIVFVIVKTDENGKFTASSRVTGHYSVSAPSRLNRTCVGYSDIGYLDNVSVTDVVVKIEARDCFIKF